MSYERITLPGDYKLPDRTETGLNIHNIAALDDRPGLTSSELKARFDRAGGDLLTYLSALVTEINGVIGALEGSGSAGNLGAAPIWDGEDSLPNVQAKLAKLKSYMDTLVIAASAGDMVKSIYDTNDDGKVNNADNAEKLGNVAASGYAKEISGQMQKTSIADDDVLALCDSAASNAQKKTLWSTVKSALSAVFAKVINGQAAMTEFSDDDIMPIYDTSEAAQKGVLWSVLKGIFAPKIAVVSDIQSTAKTITAENNTEYRFGTLTSLTVTAVPAGNFSCRILCTAGTGLTIYLPAGTKKAGGIAFVYSAGDKLQIYLDQDGATVVPFR